MVRILILLILTSSVFAQGGDNTINRIDEKGRKQGVWIKYFPNSEVKRYEGQFKNDKPVGKFSYYYEEGELRTEMFYHHENRSTVKNYFPNGNLMALGAYVDTLRDSTWTFYSYEGNKIAIEYYIAGKKYGNFKKYHANGQLLEERYFENNVENGPLKEYYDTGILAREAKYVHGSLEGDAAFYHKNGEVSFEGKYFKDTKHGIWKTYNEKGELTDERLYTKGVPEYRESDILFEDSTKYYRKDVITLEDLMPEDMLEIPPDDKTKKKK